ncbi:rRNA pseudouridine synthase [Phormidium tenue FACHB-886]|nr:rRNA pseudouridine synthase [Phormidium tenue FACHB-886]
MSERLQKILSQWGIASRRQAEQMILEGRVRLNGAVGHLGQKADPAVDRIEVDGKLIQPQRPAKLYLLLHKPLGVVSTCADPEGRSTVLELLPEALQHQSGLHPVGRLDTDSSGALLLTNDGELTAHLTHPRHDIPKTYRVWVEGQLSESALAQWRRGILLDGKPTRPAEVRVLRRYPSTASSPQGQTCLQVVLREGRNRQIRRVAAQLGYPVARLQRLAIGAIELGTLPKGAYRPLNESELAYIQAQLNAQSHPQMPEREQLEVGS